MWVPLYPCMGGYCSKSYSTAALQASFVSGSNPCLRRLPRSGNQESHAEQLCTERAEAAVEVEVGMESEDWRERLDERESWRGEDGVSSGWTGAGNEVNVNAGRRKWTRREIENGCTGCKAW